MNARLHDRTGVKCLTDYLWEHAERIPEAPAFSFLADGEAVEVVWTFAELCRRTLAVAGALRLRGMSPQTPVALMFQPGLEFIAAFLGCMAAGVIAIPVCSPKRSEELAPVAATLAAGRAQELITDYATLEILKRCFGDETPPWRIHLADELMRQDGTAPGSLPKIRSETIAFLQFTSGSTESPKGVAVSHANLIHNQQVIREGFAHGEHTTVLGWLPFYHDMGLVGNLMQPLFLGRPCILMPALAFIQKPVRWLAAIGRYNATTSGGPNFAYDLCVDAITDAQIDRCGGLSLASWQVAFSGAEPVRAETLERFERRFGPFGFRRRAFYPCYGMSETTLMLTGGAAASEARVIDIDRDALQRHVVRLTPGGGPRKGLVSCGTPKCGNSVRIVDPESCRALPEGQVGEIWAGGESIAQGYWQNEAATAAQFHACCLDFPGLHFLRTGDLGFLLDGELYVTGRLKALIIVNGKNYYPQDIEATACALHPVFRRRAAVFQDDDNGRIVLVQEVFARNAGKIDVEALEALIRKTVLARHGIGIHEVVLTTRRIPLTTSGKIRRGACLDAWRAGELPLLAATAA